MVRDWKVLCTIAMLAAPPALVGAASSAGAESTPTAAQPPALAETPPASSGAHELPPPQLRLPTALHQAFAAILQEEAARIRDLEARFVGAADPNGALEIERQMAALKSGTELRLMEARARVAREAGHFEDAAMIEAAITEMTTAQARAAAVPVIGTPSQSRSDADRDHGKAQ